LGYPPQGATIRVFRAGSVPIFTFITDIMLVLVLHSWSAN
jgi:hypothetical protein